MYIADEFPGRDKGDNSLSSIFFIHLKKLFNRYDKKKYVLKTFYNIQI